MPELLLRRPIHAGAFFSWIGSFVGPAPSPPSLPQDQQDSTARLATSQAVGHQGRRRSPRVRPSTSRPTSSVPCLRPSPDTGARRVIELVGTSTWCFILIAYHQWPLHTGLRSSSTARSVSAAGTTAVSVCRTLPGRLPRDSARMVLAYALRSRRDPHLLLDRRAFAEEVMMDERRRWTALISLLRDAGAEALRSWGVFAICLMLLGVVC